MIDYMSRVKDVCRLTYCEHNVVGNINECIDRTKAYSPETALHLEGGGLNSEALNASTDVTGATVRIKNSDVVLLNSVGRVLLYLNQGKIVECRDLTGDTVVTPEVRAVGHRLVVYLEDDIVKLESLGKRRSCGDTEGGNVHDLMIVGCREKSVKSDLYCRTYHTEGCDAAQLCVLYLNGLTLTVPTYHSTGASYDYLHACLKVRASAYDILDLTVSDIHLANSELVCVGVRKDLLDLSDDDLVKALCKILSALNLNGRHSKVIREAGKLHIFGDLYEIFDPIK